MLQRHTCGHRPATTSTRRGLGRLEHTVDNDAAPPFAQAPRKQIVGLQTVPVHIPVAGVHAIEMRPKTANIDATEAFP